MQKIRLGCKTIFVNFYDDCLEYLALFPYKNTFTRDCRLKMHLLLKNSLMELENTRCPLEQFSLSKMNQGKRSGREIFLLLYVPNFPPLPHFKSCEKMELSAKCTTVEVWKSAFNNKISLLWMFVPKLGFGIDFFVKKKSIFRSINWL